MRRALVPNPTVWTFGLLLGGSVRVLGYRTSLPTLLRWITPPQSCLLPGSRSRPVSCPTRGVRTSPLRLDCANRIRSFHRYPEPDRGVKVAVVVPSWVEIVSGPSTATLMLPKLSICLIAGKGHYWTHSFLVYIRCSLYHHCFTVFEPSCILLPFLILVPSMCPPRFIHSFSSFVVSFRFHCVSVSMVTPLRNLAIRLMNYPRTTNSKRQIGVSSTNSIQCISTSQPTTSTNGSHIQENRKLPKKTHHPSWGVPRTTSRSVKV